jgi:hypothetical protein
MFMKTVYFTIFEAFREFLRIWRFYFLLSIYDSGSFHPNSTKKKKENDTHGHGSVWLFFTVNFNQLQENISYHVDTLEL